jgi:hypothetical protein
MTSVFAVINNAKRRRRRPQPVDAALLALLAYLLALLAFFLSSFLRSLIYVSRQVSGGGNPERDAPSRGRVCCCFFPWPTGNCLREITKIEKQPQAKYKDAGIAEPNAAIGELNLRKFIVVLGRE